MPFIKGRYHVNPTMGAALEAAREAEAALLALQDHAQRDGNESADSAAQDASTVKAPIHRVEIEATELEGLPGRRLVEPGRSVPSSSGRPTRGFVARVHRSAPQASGSAGTGASCAYNLAATPTPATKPETHVFSNHGDLLDFLRDELSEA
jgi:hypothetical protein